MGTVCGGNRQRDDFLDACGSEYARGFVQGRAAGDDVIDEQQPLRQFATHSKGAADIAPSRGVGAQARLWRSPRFGEDAFGDERYAKRLRSGARRVERLVEETGMATTASTATGCARSRRQASSSRTRNAQRSAWYLPRRMMWRTSVVNCQRTNKRENAGGRRKQAPQG